MLPEMPWKEEPAVQKGWEQLVQEIERRTGIRSDGDTLEEKMEFLDSKFETRGFSAFGSHIDLALAFLLATGRLCLGQLHQVIEDQPEAATFFGDIEAGAVEMLSLCAQTAFDPLIGPAVAEFAQFGYDPNLLTQKGDRLVHLAAGGGKTEMVRALLSIGADPNLLDNKGLTALHHVLSSDTHPVSKRAIANILVACGASMDIETQAGVSPRQMAQGLGWDVLAGAPTRRISAPGSRRFS